MQNFKINKGRNIIAKVVIFFILFLMMDFAKITSISDRVILITLGASLMVPFTGERSPFMRPF